MTVLVSSGFPIVAWSYWQLNMAAGSVIRFPHRLAVGWRFRFWGSSVGTMAALCCYWLLCYRPMTLLLGFCRLVLFVGGCIASTAWLVSHAGLHSGRVVVLERKTKISLVQNWLGRVANY